MAYHWPRTRHTMRSGRAQKRARTTNSNVYWRGNSPGDGASGAQDAWQQSPEDEYACIVVQFRPPDVRNRCAGQPRYTSGLLPGLAANPGARKYITFQTSGD